MFKLLEKAIENCGWKINSDTSIEAWSPLGEDLCIECNSDDYIVNAIKREYDSFDVDEHVEFWVKNREFTNGVPSSVSALLEDAKDIEKMLEELYEAVKGYVVDIEKHPQFEYNHTLEEYMILFGDEYDNGNLWDVDVDDLFNGAIERQENNIYWIIDGRAYETNLIYEGVKQC